jgi:hypothetical protein
MLANEKVRLNDTVGRNNHLKNEINIMRKEILYIIFTIFNKIILTDLPRTVLTKWVGKFQKLKRMQLQQIRIIYLAASKQMRLIIKFWLLRRNMKKKKIDLN